MPITKTIPVPLMALLLTACDHYQPIPVREDNAERIGILITGWGEPKGYDHDFRLGLWRAQVGERKTQPDQKCTENFVGTWPHVTQVGLIPFAVGHKVEKLEAAFDSMGIYRRRGDGDYENLVNPAVILKAADIPDGDGIITSITEADFWPGRSIGPVDPRDGKELLPGVFVIKQANGISDFDEQRIASSMVDMRFMWEWMLPRPNLADRRMDRKTQEVLKALFGDRIEMRFGAYSKTPGLTELEDDVAEEFVNAGFKKLILTRETTDHNYYANKFMTYGMVWHRLCTERAHTRVDIKQTRQVGRTPEYNTALNNILERHLGYHPPGSEITLVYTTYGMPFPGGNDKGPFAIAHPLAADVYHENAYLNYQSYKRYAQAAFGDKYRLVWNHKGKSGDLRTASYYAYAMFPTRFYGKADDPLRFPTIRENIDRAKQDGRKQIIVLLSHWNYNNTDNMLGMRKLNNIPFNSRWDVRLQKFWKGWCERVNSYQEVPCDANDDDIVRLTITEVFDNQAEAFGVAYAQRIRGTVERFGELPDGIEIVAQDEISAEDGGRVRVSTGELAGIRLEVPPDPAPGKPESFRWNQYEAFVDPAKPFVGAWFDFEAYIATQPLPSELTTDLVGPPVLVGPYRTIMNKPARVTLKFDPARVPDGMTLQPVIFNEFTEGWDPVFAVAGGTPPALGDSTLSFDTQVFGLFGLRTVAASNPDELIALLEGRYRGPDATVPDPGPDDVMIDTRLRVDAPALGEHVVYWEVRSGPKQQSYRRVLNVIMPVGEGFSQSAWRLKEGLDWPEAVTADSFSSLTKDDVVPVLPDGCDSRWTKTPNGWGAYISPQDCRVYSERRGMWRGIEAMTIVSAEGLRQTERGFDDDGKQLFGTPPGEYHVLERL